MKLNQKVDQLLAAKPHYKDSDKALMLGVWWTEGLKLTDEQIEKFLNDCTTPESISRVRRKYQENGEHEASAEVKAERTKKEESYRYEQGYNKEVTTDKYRYDAETNTMVEV